MASSPPSPQPPRCFIAPSPLLPSPLLPLLPSRLPRPVCISSAQRNDARRRRPHRRNPDLFHFLSDDTSTRRPSRRPRRRKPRSDRLDQNDSDQLSDRAADHHPDYDDTHISKSRTKSLVSTSRALLHSDPETPPDPHLAVHRQTAAKAFDAVDRLFGSLNSPKPTDQLQQQDYAQDYHQQSQQNYPQLPTQQNETQLDKKSWHSDTKARAATSAHSHAKPALDVDAVHPLSSTGTPPPEQSPPENEQQPQSSERSSAAFQNFINIARKGPSTVRTPDSREKDVRTSRSSRQSWQHSPQSDSRRSTNSPPRNSLSPSGLHRVKDSYEPMDDQMEKEVKLGKDSSRNGSAKRQRYTAVRRIGLVTRPILSPPEEWRPLTAEDVDNLKTDSRPANSLIAPARFRSAVADCQLCVGEGTETCTICLGDGWVPRPKNLSFGSQDERSKLMEELWSRPNLVVDVDGNAQCMRCNGIGKQFCATCKGSGSALKKGFSLSERYEVFDMFPPVDDDVVLGEDHDIDEFSDEEDHEDEFETFQLYRGSVDSFDFSTGKNLKNATDRQPRDAVLADGREEAEHVLNDPDEGPLDNVDESDELLAALEAMHIREQKHTSQPDQVLAQQPNVLDPEVHAGDAEEHVPAATPLSEPLDAELDDDDLDVEIEEDLDEDIEAELRFGDNEGFDDSSGEVAEGIFSIDLDDEFEDE